MSSLCTGPYQASLGTTLIGDDSSTPVRILSVRGLGSSVAPSMAKYDLADGAAGGVDTNDVRSVVMVLEIFAPGDEDTAGEWHQTLAELFAAATSDQTLYVWMPGIGHRSILGRPRGMDDDGLVDLPLGLVEVTCRFDGLAAALTEVP